ncbi:helix-turn-helix transcriptional regulator [Brevundimonas subvibrioides]|uniref:helix-turn-helix transcriptional regulator n=1 Tax=Brevundimonas subvibrioides TaxID=74313 RepID=UPI0022B4048F|nr:AraC family transcriptional regulator [Brevundimonas subvibrioides]
MDQSPPVAVARRCLVVSPELTVLIGRGPFADFPMPDAAVAAVFGFGTIDTPATLTLAGIAHAQDLVGEDTGVTRILLLIAASGLARISALTLPGADDRLTYHLPSDLRAIALALRDCERVSEAGDIYRTAKSIELLCETWSALDKGVMVPVAGDSDMSRADSLRLLTARRLIDEQWREKLSLHGIAAQCGLNREKLTRGFRQMFACSVAEALAERRLTQASLMLATTDLPVSSVGYENGYLNNASFARAFGRRFGQSPSDYRAARIAA